VDAIDAGRRETGGLVGPSTPRQHGERESQHTEAAPRRDQTHLQQQRHERARGRDAESDAGEDHATGEAAASRRNVRHHGRRSEGHQRSAGDSGRKTPDEIPDERAWRRAGEERRDGDHHHRAQHGDRAQACGDRPRDERTREISGQVGGAEVGGVSG